MSWKVTSVVRLEKCYLEFHGELEGHLCSETRDMVP